jgi:hypothetical protein
MQMDPNFVYYFFSTIAQCAAAITGISATIAVLRYSSLQTSLTAKQDYISDGLGLTKNSLLIKWFRANHQYRRAFNELTSSSQRCDWLKKNILPILNPSSGRTSLDPAPTLGELVSSNEQNNIDDLISCKKEFEALEQLRSQFLPFRLSIICSTILGLLLIFFSIVFLFIGRYSSHSDAPCYLILAIIFVSFLSVLFIISLCYVFMSAFLKPSEF